MPRPTGPANGIVVSGGIRFHYRTHPAGTLNSQHYICEVLEPVVLPYIQRSLSTVFQQDNARAGSALDTPPAATPDQVWHYVEGAWTTVPQGYIQNFFDFMPRRVAAVIPNKGSYTNYRFYHHPHVERDYNFNHLIFLQHVICQINFAVISFNFHKYFDGIETIVMVDSFNLLNPTQNIHNGLRLRNIEYFRASLMTGRHVPGHSIGDEID
ncbi:uncharacterized protein TNCV_787721 [Trichonephila clavipes]|nr:uncharacterized protein TNCV_787721 [Trichonephila clavipes]